MKFGYLRKTKWNPTFEWVSTSMECADKINSYHEDYPKYVEITNEALRVTVGSIIIPNWKLLAIHEAIFADKPFKGRWRDVGVIVGQHRPPHRENIADLMDELASSYTIASIGILEEWYKDFETIHPFEDGNGRVGGLIVAVHAHAMRPEMGWLAPNQ
ncbi:hypothetical protein LCGC14_0543890 [marine sediment metagenome]|uniref:Fido domain-containing protein n=1 Tax=marine sediment metagenome TaxID=412755 RepID=A0A0F9RS85_9ZZZZ